MQTEMPPKVAEGMPEPEPIDLEAELAKVKERAEAQLAELRWTRLLLKSLALVCLVYCLVAGILWAGSFISEQIPALISKIFA
ncbi:MAG: hypothetical protein GX444_21475 [Myxococcales bacterium]|nr:hypothetical protein [Myxococcales bacterium]